MKPNALVSPGLVKSSLRRFWPLWLALFIQLALTVIAPLYSAVIELSQRPGTALAEKVASMDSVWTTAQVGGLVFAFVAADRKSVV